MPSTKKESRSDVLLRAVETYRQEKKLGDQPLDTKDLVRFAKERFGLIPLRADADTLLGREFSRAMRQVHVTDDQGRIVRKYHVVRETTEDGLVQRTLWGTIHEARPEFMRKSVVQRREIIVHDVLRLKIDLDSYNDNNKHGARLRQLVWDFTNDIKERESSSEYQADPFSDDEEEGDERP